MPPISNPNYPKFLFFNLLSQQLRDIVDSRYPTPVTAMTRLPTPHLCHSCSRFSVVVPAPTRGQSLVEIHPQLCPDVVCHRRCCTAVVQSFITVTVLGQMATIIIGPDKEHQDTGFESNWRLFYHRRIEQQVCNSALPRALWMRDYWLVSSCIRTYRSISNQHNRKRNLGEFSCKLLEELSRLAKLVEMKEHWEFTVDEISILKFLFDGAQNFATVRDHMDHCLLEP
ncbi:methyl-CpG-binding domain-containing protein 9-like [Salvia divinorum]|uniref:Methyl-CpG-binding domain-containing protein 9-like n=1 Tax=Salvia divinorum TaxID=28513 RepID=A0ABD1G8Q5_SALDI